MDIINKSNFDQIINFDYHKLFCKNIKDIDARDFSFISYLKNHFIISLKISNKINSRIISSNPQYTVDFYYDNCRFKPNRYGYNLLDFNEHNEEYALFTLYDFIYLFKPNYEILNDPLDRENKFVCYFNNKLIRYNNDNEFNKTVEGYFNCFSKIIDMYFNE